jgi:hypothetical protein
MDDTGINVVGHTSRPDMSSVLSYNRMNSVHLKEMR